MVEGLLRGHATGLFDARSLALAEQGILVEDANEEDAIIVASALFQHMIVGQVTGALKDNFLQTALRIGIDRVFADLLDHGKDGACDEETRGLRSLVDLNSAHN